MAKTIRVPNTPEVLDTLFGLDTEYLIEYEAVDYLDIASESGDLDYLEQILPAYE